MSDFVVKRKLSIPQYRGYNSTARHTALIAGFGSGKSDLLCSRGLDTLFLYRGADVGYFAPTIPLIKDIFFPKISDYLDRAKIRHRILDQKNIVVIPKYGRIICKSMSDPNSIIGFEILDALVDELDNLTLDKGINAYRKIKARCRQKIKNNKYQKKFWKMAGYKKPKFKPNQIFTGTTPEGFKSSYHLFKKKGQEHYLEDCNLIQMSTYTNLRNLPVNYISDLLSMYPKELVKAYILGIFINLTNKPVYNSFDRYKNNSDHVVEGNEILEIGIDFNVGRGCCAIFVEREHPTLLDENFLKAKFLVCVDEIINTYDTPETIKIIKKRYPNNPIIFYPDASGKNRKSVNATTSDITLLKQELKCIVKVRGSNPIVKDRINAVNGMFCNSKNQRRLLVNTEKCPQITDALEQQIYDKNGQPEKGENKKDDQTDAFGYPIAYKYPIKKIKFTTMGI